MSAIRVRDIREAKWITGRDYSPPDQWHLFSDEELDQTVNVHEPGDDSTLELFEVNLDPGRFVDVHSHASDEIIYVVKGSLELGKRSLGPGSSVFVKANTLYSFRAGPEGLQYLNFRPHRDLTHRSRDEHMAWLQSQRREKQHGDDDTTG